tara:strand:- start:1504 stop:1896 length:393 start_codon:yes stop_codon:yes gene_type:complete
MKNIKLFEHFINENINKRIPEFVEKIEKAEVEFETINKRSELLKLFAKTPGADVIDQNTKFTYSPDGEIFVVYKYADQNAVDDWLYHGKGSEKSKEKLVGFTVYAETGRPGYRVMSDGSKTKIGKHGETK